MIATVSLLIVRVGATAFKMTGLSRDVANFQALSCFFGVGFTTKESEMIVSHPVRRKIASHLIVIGNIGVMTALSALVVTFVQSEPGWLDKMLGAEEGVLPYIVRVALILSGITLIFMLFRFHMFSRPLEFIIQRTLEKAGVVKVMDFNTVLRTSNGFAVSEFEIDPGHPLSGVKLGDSDLGHRGVLVLGIDREGGKFIGTPRRSTELRVGDVLTVYGKEQIISHELSPEGTRAAMQQRGGTEIA